MCAVFGLIDYKRIFNNKQRERILKTLSVECEIRGTDAVGFAFNGKGRLRIFKRPLPAHEVNIRLSDDANIIHGHTRMATQGDKNFNYNNHPFSGYAGREFALAHNGILYNENAVRRELNIPETHIKTDSYIAVQILEKLGERNEVNLAQMAEKVNGSFVFTVLDEDSNSYFVCGDNPLALYHFDAGFYIYASTEAILEKALTTLGIAKFRHEKIECGWGDILKIDRSGNLSRSFFMPDVQYYWDYDCYNEQLDYIELFQRAERYGIDEEYIELLLDYGYMPEEIEDLLEIHGAVEMAVHEIEILNGYDRVEEW